MTISSSARHGPSVSPTHGTHASVLGFNADLANAPTPHNTRVAPDVYGSVSERAQHGRSSSGEEPMYNDVNGHVSLNPSIPLSSHPSLASQIPSSFSPTASSSYLLPYTSSSPSVISYSVPNSTKPIPAPPLSFRPYTTALSTDLATPTTETASFSSLPAIVRDISKASGSISDLESSSVGGSTGHRLKQEEVDAQRLRQLGYNSVLGRDYTFWSSLSISWLNIGCLQVFSSVNFVDDE